MKAKAINIFLSVIVGILCGIAGLITVLLVAQGIYKTLCIPNFLFGMGIGPIFYLTLFLGDKVMDGYYPTSSVKSFVLQKRLIRGSITALFLLTSIGGYVGIVYPMSMTLGMGWLAVFLALPVCAAINMFGLFFLALFSFPYNKAVLLEKIEANTRNDK